MKAEINRYQSKFDIDPRKINARDRENLILKYAPIVKYIADRMVIRLPSNISKQELTSAGIVGLLDALDRFDSEVGVKFQTYAEHRIRGAMLDELRKMDWIPRSVRKDIHMIEDTITALQSKLGREPEDFEVAQEMNIDLNSYYKMMNRAGGVSLFSLDDIIKDGSMPKLAMHTSDAPSPFDELKKKELKKIIYKALLTLPKREQLFISLYYYDALT